MKASLALCALMFGASFAHADSSSCHAVAQSEANAFLGDQIDLPCNDMRTQLVTEATRNEVTAYTLLASCGAVRIPSSVTIYLTDDCSDATPDQVDAYLGSK